MLFGKQPSAATSGKLAPQQDASRPSVVISSASSLAPSVTSTVATPTAKSGLFSKWQRPSGTSSTSSVSIHDQAIISELRKKNAVLLDHNDGLMQAHQLNQETVQKLADDCEAREQECKQLRASNGSLSAQLEFSIQEANDKTAALQAQLQELTACHDELTNKADTFNAKQASLQQEKNALADKVKKYEQGTDSLNQQIKVAFTQLSIQQQSSENRVDAMYAQQLRTEQRTDEQLKAKDATIRELQAKLKQSKLTTSKALASREDELTTLSVQLKHSDIERNTQAQLANEWQDCSNVHLARVLELEEQVKQLTARCA